MMTAEQLKGSILQLAIQGKLVSQESSEGNAASLIQEIKKKKQFLIKQGIIKKEKELSPIAEDEIPFDIPETWEWVRLGDYAEKVTDYVASGSFASLRENAPSLKTEDYAILVKTADFSNDFTQNLTYTTKHGYEFLNNSNLFGGELVLSNIGSIGKVFIVPKLNRKMTLAPNSVMVRLADDQLRDYLYHFLLSPLGYEELIAITSGTAMKKFNKTDLKTILIPIPPLAEQKRIVAKIEELMPFVEQYAAASTKLNTLYTTFPDMMKKSILQEAVQGKLVPQDPNDEPASVLLKKIEEEKKRLVKEGVLKKDKKESVIFRGEDGLFYETIGKKTECIQDQIPFDIPDTWEWLRLRGYGQFSSGKTPSMSNPKNWDGNIPWVSPKDMKTEVITDSQMHISGEACSEMTLYPKGTLLMVVRSGILKRKLPLCVLGVDSTINQDLKAFSFYDNELSEWIYYELRGFEHYILHNLVKNVTTVDSLKFGEFQDMLVPLPPRKEQIRIIEKVKEALKEINYLANDVG